MRRPGESHTCTGNTEHKDSGHFAVGFLRVLAASGEAGDKLQVPGCSCKACVPLNLDVSVQGFLSVGIQRCFLLQQFCSTACCSLGQGSLTNAILKVSGTENLCQYHTLAALSSSQASFRQPWSLCLTKGHHQPFGAPAPPFCKSKALDFPLSEEKQFLVL